MSDDGKPSPYDVDSIEDTSDVPGAPDPDSPDGGGATPSGSGDGDGDGDGGAAASGDGASSDVLFEYEMLKKRMIKDSSMSKQLRDKVFFLLMKLKAKDDQTAGMKEALRVKAKEAAALQADLDAAMDREAQLGKKVALMKTTEMQLEYEKFQLQTQLDKAGGEGGRGAGGRAPESEVAHVRGVEKAKMLLAHQLFKQQSAKQIETLTAEKKGLRREQARKLEGMEQVCMAYEDEHAPDTLHAVMRTLKLGRYQQGREASTTFARDFVRDLRFDDNTEVRAPDDPHVAALLARSNYSALLYSTRTDLAGTAMEMKSLSDKTLQSLWLLFNEKSSSLSGGGAHVSGKPFRRIFEDFYKTIDQALIRSKVFERIRATRFSTVDQSVQVAVRPDTPKEVYDLRSDVTAYQRRLRELSKETAEKEHAMELRASKAESNLMYLQRHILQLHRTSFTALHLVYKHRYRWTNRLPDPMRTLRIPEAKERHKALEVSFNMKLGDLLQCDTQYMEQFGNYMMSEDFGANAVTAGSAGGGGGGGGDRGAPAGAHAAAGRRASAAAAAAATAATHYEDPSPAPHAAARLPRAPSMPTIASASRLATRRLSLQDLRERDARGTAPAPTLPAQAAAAGGGSAGGGGGGGASRISGGATPDLVPIEGARSDPSPPPALRRHSQPAMAGAAAVAAAEQRQQLTSLPSFAQPIGRLKKRASSERQIYFTSSPAEKTDEDTPPEKLQPFFSGPKHGFVGGTVLRRAQPAAE